MSIKQKLTSRKFWVTIAAMLASIGSAIGGAYVDNTTIIMVGVICTAVSTCIYTISESMVDAKAVGNSDESEG